VIVGLFDETFRHDICSTGWKTPAHIQYVRDRMEFDGVTLFTDGYVNSGIADRVKCPVKIGWLHEPQCLYPSVYTHSIGNSRKFDTILTYYAPLLELPKYRFMPYAGTWIKPENWGMSLKTQLCSMLYGMKAATEGHRLRPVIADALASLDVDFFGARGERVDYSPGTKLKVLGDYAFSIVIEACREDNLFTEILLDCFTVGTIPIFWGAPNIGEFFDLNGILMFETAEQCRDIISDLSWDMYSSMRSAAVHNLGKVKQYAVAEDWLYENVLEEYNR